MSLVALIVSSAFLGQVTVVSPPPNSSHASSAVEPISSTYRGSSANAAVGSGIATSTPEMPPTGPARSGAAPERLPSTAPALVDDALSLPAGSTLTGKPIPLLTLVSTVPDHRSQVDAVQAYWKLAEAIAGYRFSLDENQTVGRLRGSSEEAIELRSAKATSAANLQEAELAATAAQHELAYVLKLPIDSPLPLPADRPHVGSYRTYFSAIFSTQNAPARAKFIDQTLPLRSKAIEEHVLAIQAAETALDAATDAQSSGSGSLSAILACMNACARERRAFMTSVCRYNHDIAEYALVAVAPKASPDVLVGMLIKQNREIAGSEIGALPASYQEPIPPSSPPLKNWPTRAVRPLSAQTSDPSPLTPTQPPVLISPPASAGLPAPEGMAYAPPREMPVNLGRQVPTLAPLSDAPPDSIARLRAGVQGMIPAGTSAPIPRATNKPVVDPQSRTTSSIYQALVGIPAPDQAIRLAAAMVPDRELPLETSYAVTLQECLRAAPTAGRRKTIDDYWLARRNLAQDLALKRKRQHLDDLMSFAAEPATRNSEPKLYLAALQSAADAASLDSQIALTEVQFQLASDIGRESDGPWITPATMPFAGRCSISQGVVARTWTTRRLEASINGLSETVSRDATAVVESDLDQSNLTARFASGRASLEQAVAGIDAEYARTDAFLQALTDYNRAIGEYALSALPPGAPVEKLVAMLGTR